MAGRRTVSERAAAQAKPSVRTRLAEDLDERYEKVLTVIETALDAKKKVRVFNDCAKCGCKHAVWVEVNDVQAAMKAAEFFANQGLGRPGEDQTARGGGDFVVERYVVDPKED